MNEVSANRPGGRFGGGWRFGRRGLLTLDRPRIIAILNVTPDSFSDGGRSTTPEAALAAAHHAVTAGADMIDVGGESTRPGAARVDAQEQIRRVVPVIRLLRAQHGPLGAVPLSVDTTLSEVAREAIDAGADAMNDVSAGADDSEMFTTAARLGCGLIVMHRCVPPGADRYSDQYEREPEFTDVVLEVREWLERRASAALAAGVFPGSIVIDPGLGFGKSVEQNLQLIRGTPRLLELGFPVLSAASRKSFVGRVSLERDSNPNERDVGSVATSVAHFALGARLFRVHDAQAHVQALRVAAGLFSVPCIPTP